MSAQAIGAINGISGLSAATRNAAVARSSKNSGIADFSQALVSQIDADKSGSVDSVELTNATQSILSQLNGVSSQMRASKAAGASVDATTATSLIGKLSQTGASSLDITDTGLTQAQFDKIDLDHDGKLDAGELQNVINKASGQGSASKKFGASQAECASIIAELQAKSAAKQYETQVKADAQASAATA